MTLAIALAAAAFAGGEVACLTSLRPGPAGHR